MKARMRMHWIAAAAAAVALAACGGGGGDTTPRENVTSVKVMGDSLADVGTFGFKNTVQASATALTGPGSSQLWVDRVAERYKVDLCAHYRSADGGASFSTVASCTGYAVGGGRINYFANPQSPISITKQMADAGAAGYKPDDLVLIDGGGNDAGDLFGAYIAASTDGGKNFFALMGTMLDAATVQALAAQGAAGMPKAGAAYMQALAVYFSKNIQANVLGKGGHFGEDANDVLVTSNAIEWYNGQRIDTPNTHGTGCTLSSAIASNLAKGYVLEEAVWLAKDYLTGALLAGLSLGKGHGPLHHGFALSGDFFG